MGDDVRKAFEPRLKPGALEQHVSWHDTIWTELQGELAKEAILEISLFQRDDSVSLFSRVRDDAAWDRRRDSDVHRRWGELMGPLMHERDDGIVDSREPTEIWHGVPGRAVAKE